MDYMSEYKRWLDCSALSADEHAELAAVEAGGDDGNVAALGDLLALADLKVIVLGIVEHRHNR